MNFQSLPKDVQVALSLELTRRAAEIGRPSFFNRWWFFDTNCLSELVKMTQRGLSEQVRSFVASKDILLTATILKELRKAPNILESLELALETANVFLAPDITRFWYTDIFNFVNIDHVQFNSLEVYPLQSGFLKELTGKYKEKFEEVCTTSERELARLYPEAVQPDIGGNADERDLCVYIWSRVNSLSQERFKIDIPVADCHSGNFPSFYVHFYTYYFRYIKNSTAKPKLNDFTDMAHCMAAPYCERFYCESSFASILKNNVQGRRPPTAYQLVTKTHKKGLIDSSIYREKKQKKPLYDQTHPMLAGTQIYNYAEMVIQVSNHNTAHR
jgi:hypothetical protein